MTHQRNVDGLRQSAKQRHEETVQRLEHGLRELVRAGRPITFQTVAAAAGVSTAWLYQHPEVKERIIGLRAQSADHRAAPAVRRASEASKEAMIAALRQRIRTLEEENRELRKQLEVVYGQIYQQESGEAGQR
jgi:hypothetical protein